MALTGNILNIVITLGIIIISLFVMFLYLKLRANKKNITELSTKKRNISQCPDYWESIGENLCKNIHGLGESGRIINIADFNGEIYQDEETAPELKCHWAKIAKVPWQYIDKLC
tara:strand:- start:2599 stop:2940 length:342 start_codon:yes stop_codon:yes gene_type:complete